MTFSNLVPFGFIALSLGLAWLLAYATWRAGRRLRESATVRERWTAWAVVIPAVLLPLTAALAFSGVLDNLDARPPLVALVIGLITVGTVALALSRFGERLMLAWSLSALVGYQAFRIIVEALLAGAHSTGAVPADVTWLGYNFDVLTGLGALGIAVWAQRGSVPRAAVWAWNVVGLILLSAVVVTAARSAFGFTATEPRMTFLVTWPGIWLPTWLVQAALFGHVLVFRRLLRKPGSRSSPEARAQERSAEKTGWNMPRVTPPAARRGASGVVEPKAYGRLPSKE